MSQLYQYLDIMNRPADLSSHLLALQPAIGVVLVAVGAVCLLKGYRWHRGIMVALALLLGFGVGKMLSSEVGRVEVICMAIGIGIAAITFSSPKVLKPAAALFAGIVGAIIGVTLWGMLNVGQPDLAWTGAAIGFIVLALMSFICFRIIVILFTSVGGGVMLVLGSITLLYHSSDLFHSSGEMKTLVYDHLLDNSWKVPVLVLIAAAFGFVRQDGLDRGEGVASSDEE